MFKNCKVIGDGISYEEYHRQTAKRGDNDYFMSRSELIEFSVCPAKWILGPHGDDSSKSTEWGSLIDCLLTQRDKFDSLFAVRPETYPDKKTSEPKPFNMNSTWCKEWVESQKGKIVIKPEIILEAESSVKAIQSDADVSELIKVSRKQVFVIGFWEDPATKLEIPVRILLDLVPPADHPTMGKWLADFKTARSGDPAAWARVVDDSGYDVQAALYSDIYTAATKEDRTDWVFAVQENVAPFHVVKPLMSITEEFLAWGRVKYQSALTFYCQCLAKNEWPSYSFDKNKLMFGLNKIEPQDLWTYKKTAGQGSLDARNEYKQQPAPTPNDGEVIP